MHRGRNVLVIDDDSHMRTFLVVALEPLGYVVRTAKDGAEGVRLFLAERPDCVLCDVFMPGRDGLEVIPELRRLDKGVPVVAMSGGSAAFTEDLLPVARRLGASAALQKPFTLHGLRECLDRVLA